MIDDAYGGPKMLDLQDSLDIPLYQAAGIFEGLLIYCQRHVRSGEIPESKIRRIVRFLGWEGDAGKLIMALCNADILDHVDLGGEDRNIYLLHGWTEHAPRYIRRYWKANPSDSPNPDLWPPEVDRPSTVSRTPVDGTSTQERPTVDQREALPNQTQPDPTQLNQNRTKDPHPLTEGSSLKGEETHEAGGGGGLLGWSEHDKDAMEQALRGIGIAKASECLSEAESGGAIESEVWFLISYYRTRVGAWRPEGLAWRISKQAPGLAIADGWPEPQKEYTVGVAQKRLDKGRTSKAQADKIRDEQIDIEREEYMRLEARYGPELEYMKSDQIEGLFSYGLECYQDDDCVCSSTQSIWKSMGLVYGVKSYLYVLMDRKETEERQEVK